MNSRRPDGNMHVRSRKNNGSTSFAIDNMCYVNFRIWEQKSVPWCDEFQNKVCKHLGILLIFTPIPLMPKMCGLLISNVNLFKRELESVQHSHTPFHASCSFQNSVCFSPYNWSSNWASLLGLSNWALACGLEWDQKGPIRL